MECVTCVHDVLAVLRDELVVERPVIGDDHGAVARLEHLTIECEELYRSASDLPVSNRWMVFCCNAMRAEMAILDEIIFDDVKESLLKVKYRLPRTSTKPPLVRAPE